jgi:hypothetical protein
MKRAETLRKQESEAQHAFPTISATMWNGAKGWRRL